MSRILIAAVVIALVPWRIEAIAESRELYPEHNGGCYFITSRAECCRHKDGRNRSEAGHYLHENCVPAAEGKQFTSGRVCEPECWVQGLCGDGSPQGDRVGQCHSLHEDDILVASEDTSTMTRTTTYDYVDNLIFDTSTRAPGQISNKEKIIAGAVAGSVGGVALVGGLLGGLLTTEAPTTPNVRATSTVLSTATTTAASTSTANLSHTRFLEDDTTMQTPITQYLGGSPWMAGLALGALSAVACLVVGFDVRVNKQGTRDFARAVEPADSTDAESMSPVRGSAPEVRYTRDFKGNITMVREGDEAFDLIDKNHDGVISREEFNAAYGMQHMASVAVAPPVYVLPSSAPVYVTSAPSSAQYVLPPMAPKRGSTVWVQPARDGPSSLP